MSLIGKMPRAIHSQIQSRIDPWAVRGERRAAERSALRLAFGVLCWEGAFSTLYDTWFGSMYISGLAGEVGASLAWVAVLTAIPYVGTVGQLFGAWAFSRFDSYRRYVILTAMISRLIWIVPVSSALYWGARLYFKAEVFPVGLWFKILAACACIAGFIGNASSVAWLSWTKALVPGKFQGRFFGVRQRYTMGALVAAHLVAMFWVGVKPEGYLVGYGMLGLLAVAAAFLSIHLLKQIPEPARRYRPLQHSLKRRGFIETFSEPFRDPKFRPVVLHGAAFNGALMLGSPFFTYWFTKELQIPMSSISAWSIAMNLGCFLISGVWGKKIDRARASQKVLWTTGHLVAIAPLWYVLPSAQVIRWLAPVEYFTNGLAWSGYTLAMTSLLLSSSPKRKNAAYFSVYAASVGLMGALGAFLGGELASLLEPWGGFRALWVLSSLGRIGVLYFVCRPLIMKPYLERGKREDSQDSEKFGELEATPA